ncbi:MAG: hypothetical protein WA020_07865 [Candidatus Acidiferrales bacterium]
MEPCGEYPRVEPSLLARENTMGAGRWDGISGAGIAFTARRVSRGAEGMAEVSFIAETLAPAKANERWR